MNANELEERILTAVAKSLDLDVSEVGLDTGLLGELEAESLDLLEISFRLERDFNIALPRVNLLQHAEEVFGPGTLIDQGQLTDLGLRVLAAMRPEVEAGQFKPGLTWREVAQQVTPRNFSRMTQSLLAAKAAFIAESTRCPECGSHEFTASTTVPEMNCGACEASVAFPSGDQLLLARLRELHVEFVAREGERRAGD
ncbi:MAG: acyl carrier protein [Enhygromyxa sp.]